MITFNTYSSSYSSGSGRYISGRYIGVQLNRYRYKK
jgi:hypothetical protein